MTFRFRVEGAPASWNRAFRVTKGAGRMQISKTAEAADWQGRVQSACERAKPRDWEKTTEYLRIRYWFNLKRRSDPDNLLKMINDGIALGLGTKVVNMRLRPVIDDACFLPEVVNVTTGNKEPWVEIEVAPHEG